MLVVLMYIVATSSRYEYRFDPAEVKTCVINVGTTRYYATISESGEYIPMLSSYSVDCFIPENRVSHLASVDDIIRNGELLYEYRSAMLIPMIKDPVHGIVPEIGGRIIRLSDYLYSPISRRIYNLPGQFILRK